MKMQEIQEGETEKFDSEERRKTLDTAKIIENEENMSEILKQKLKTLTSIDTESLKTASMENLVKLVGMMEDTLQQVQTHMQMPVIKPQTKTVNNMQMPVIKQAARNQFLVKMHKVDEAALDRAANA
jgi:hypothetical protein